MAILHPYTKKSKGYSGQKPTVSDLHEFPDVGIHLHAFNLALFLKNWLGEKVTPSGAVDLIKQKFYQRPQRRDLQPREVEHRSSKCIRFISNQKKSFAKGFYTQADDDFSGESMATDSASWQLRGHAKITFPKHYESTNGLSIRWLRSRP